MDDIDRSGDEVAVAVLEHDLDGPGVRRADRLMRDLGTALAHTVVVDATRVRHIGARGLLLLDAWVRRWQALGLRVRLVASHHVARAVGVAGADHVVYVTYTEPGDGFADETSGEEESGESATSSEA